MPATITAIINQKGGTGKTCTCASLGIGLAREGKNVLLVAISTRKAISPSAWAMTNPMIFLSPLPRS